jgi:1-acyl-sn-glycerol-3-phosphate acyltransferase
VSVDAVRRGVPGAALAVQLGRRARGAYAVDEWGLDPDLVSVADPVLGLRWELSVQGAEQLPAVGGAVLVFNRRFGVSEPWVLARGIRLATGRFVRTVGVPDVAPVGPLLRRFGGVLDRTDEIAGLLRAGQLVGLPMSRDVRSRERVGQLEVARLEAALETGAPVVPVALVGRETGRSWRIVVGEPVPPNPDGGPLAAAELAESTRQAVQDLLDESLPTSWWF